MGGIFFTAINAIVPVILLILLGYILKRAAFFTDAFIKTGNKFVFRVCLPCMLFINVYDSMNSFSDIRWDVVGYCVAVIVLMFAVGLLCAVSVTEKSGRRGVILQCSFRSNFAVIGLAIVERLGGNVALAGIISAFSIPVFNVLAVIALSVFAEKELSDEPPQDGQQTVKRRGRAVETLKNIATNPLICGIAVGLLFVGIREIERAANAGQVVFSFKTHLTFLYEAVRSVKLIASPLALIVLGGQFKFGAVKGMTKEIIAGTVLRVVISPLAGVGIAVLLSKTPLFEFGADVYPALLALFGTPVAVSSAIMAGEMRCDEQLATQLVVWTSVSSVITIFISVVLLMRFGLIAV